MLTTEQAGIFTTAELEMDIALTNKFSSCELVTAARLALGKPGWLTSEHFIFPPLRFRCFSVTPRLALQRFLQFQLSPFWRSRITFSATAL